MVQIMKASTIAAPWRHQRVTGRLARLTASALKAETEHEGDGDAVDIPLHGAGDMPAVQRDEMHGEDADAHHQAAGFRRQGEMAAADLEPDEAGDDRDDEHEAGGDRLEAARQCGSSARMEMKVEAQSAAPVPTEAMNSQPVRVDAFGGARAGKMAHADPGAEQADAAGEHHQELMVR